MSILSSSLLDNLNRNIGNQKSYLKLISELPKGKITTRKRRNNNYYYLEYRESNKIIYDYLGATSNFDIEEIEQKIKERKIYQERIKKLKAEEKELRKVLKSLGEKIEF